MFNKIKNFICIVLIVMLIPMFFVSAIILADSFINPNEVPSFFGWKPLIVLSGSMETEIYAGDVALVKECNASDLKIGDIIAFKTGETVITHRIKEIKYEEGITKIITKGDNNNTEDFGYITSEQIEGIYKFKVSGLGNTAMFIQTPTGMIACLSIPIGILIILQMAQTNEEKKKLKQKIKEKDDMQKEIEKLKKENEELLKK